MITYTIHANLIKRSFVVYSYAKLKGNRYQQYKAEVHAANRITGLQESVNTCRVCYFDEETLKHRTVFYPILICLRSRRTLNEIRIAI